ncbi:MAG: hypothetical protein JJT76_10355 [Clostridiaceae bacterium]|nr:hypothetical protein [Clostridiaceae bacterium]
MNKKLIIAAVAVMCIAVLAGGATFAWFTSEAESTGNVIVTGDLKMDVERVHDNDGEGLSYVFDNLQPGDTSATDGMTPLTWIVKNDGSMSGDFTMEIDNAKGALQMKIHPYYFVDGKWVPKWPVLIDGNVIGPSQAITLAPGEEVKIDVTWEFGILGGRSVGNAYQGQELTFDTAFELNQTRP